MKKRKAAWTPRDFLTQRELTDLFGVIESKRDKAIFLLAYQHGLRACEIGTLRRDDIDLEAGRITIRRAKGSLGGTYPVRPKTLAVLKAYLKTRKDESKILFQTRVSSAIGPRMLNKLIAKYGEIAGIANGKWHFHILKHSIVTHLLEARTDIITVQHHVGHRKIQNTMVYTHLANPIRDERIDRAYLSGKVVG